MSSELYRRLRDAGIPPFLRDELVRKAAAHVHDWQAAKVWYPHPYGRMVACSCGQLGFRYPHKLNREGKPSRVVYTHETLREC